MTFTESQIRRAATALITAKLKRQGITPLPDVDIWDDVPEEIKEEHLEYAEAVLLSLDDSMEAVK